MQIKEIVLKNTMDMDKKLGSLEVFVEAQKDENEQGKVFLWAQLVNEQQEEVDRIFPMELVEQTQFCMEVESPRLWNTEYPYLYELVLELRDEENRLLGCTSKVTGFYYTSLKEGRLLLNDQAVSWRRTDDISGIEKNLKDSVWLREFLGNLRCRFYNCIYIPDILYSRQLCEYCVEYGILLLNKEMAECCEVINRDTVSCIGHPDFEIQVVEDGVLIENKSCFINTNVYSLRCEILSEDRILQQSMVEADVSADSSRYLELPFIKPQKPGIYRYCVSLCLKKDMSWGKKGTVIARGEALISNLWLG